MSYVFMSRVPNTYQVPFGMTEGSVPFALIHTKFHLAWQRKWSFCLDTYQVPFGMTGSGPLSWNILSPNWHDSMSSFCPDTYHVPFGMIEGVVLVPWYILRPIWHDRGSGSFALIVINSQLAWQRQWSFCTDTSRFQLAWQKQRYFALIDVRSHLAW